MTTRKALLVEIKRVREELIHRLKGLIFGFKCKMTEDQYATAYNLILELGFKPTKLTETERVQMQCYRFCIDNHKTIKE